MNILMSDFNSSGTWTNLAQRNRRRRLLGWMDTADFICFVIWQIVRVKYEALLEFFSHDVHTIGGNKYIERLYYFVCMYQITILFHQHKINFHLIQI